MKNLNFLLIFSFMFSLAILSGCNKKEDPEPEPEPTPVTQNDQAPSAEFDGAMENVNDMINNNIGGGSNYRMSAYNLPCGVVSVDSTTTNSNSKKIYKMQYGNQTPCGYKYKSGQVSFQLESGTTYGAVGAVSLVIFTDYTVQVLATGDILKLNGTIRVTNVDGGYLWQTVVNSATIRHRIRGTLNITFANGQVRERKYFQLRTWTAPTGWSDLSLNVAGDTTIATVNVSELGKTYDGSFDFQTQILTDFFWTNCGTTFVGPYRLQSGDVKMDITIPLISPTYIQAQAGYYWDYNNSLATPTLVNDCTSNAYKITTVIGTSTTTSYQLY